MCVHYVHKHAVSKNGGGGYRLTFVEVNDPVHVDSMKSLYLHLWFDSQSSLIWIVSIFVLVQMFTTLFSSPLLT